MTACSALRYNHDSYGWQYVDGGSGSMFKERYTSRFNDAEPVFSLEEAYEFFVNQGVIKCDPTS